MVTTERTAGVRMGLAADTVIKTMVLAILVASSVGVQTVPTLDQTSGAGTIRTILCASIRHAAALHKV